MTIPNVTFSHKQSNHSEVEVFELSSLQQRVDLKPSPQQIHRVNFFMLIFIEEGVGEHTVDFKHYPFSSGSLIFIQREQVHSFDFSNQIKGKVLMFTQAFLDHIHANMHLPNYTPTHLNPAHSPILSLPDSLFRRSLILINEMLTEQSDLERDPLISMYLFSALALLIRKQSRHNDSGNLSQTQSKKLSLFFTLLQAHYCTIRDASWYAEQIHVTYKTLNVICKSATGLTAKQMIDAFVILEVKRQLVLRKISVQQLTYEFGFDDASNFVKFFKKHSGLTPSQFQQKYQPKTLDHNF